MALVVSVDVNPKFRHVRLPHVLIQIMLDQLPRDAEIATDGLAQPSP
jgi:hypothetical protein